MIDDLTKTCSFCREDKTLSSFHRNKSKPSGFNSQCKECCSKKHKIYYKNYSQKIKEKARNYRVSYDEKVKQQKIKYREANLDQIKQKDKEYYKKNYKEVRQRQKDYYQKTKHKYFERNSRRRVIKLTSQPVWLSKDQLFEIQAFYWLAQDLKVVTGEVYHVDHIVPLQGEDVCGLHVPWNLQILPSDLNIAKSNRM